MSFGGNNLRYGTSNRPWKFSCTYPSCPYQTTAADKPVHRIMVFLLKQDNHNRLPVASCNITVSVVLSNLTHWIVRGKKYVTLLHVSRIQDDRKKGLHSSWIFRCRGAPLICCCVISPHVTFHLSSSSHCHANETLQHLHAVTCLICRTLRLRANEEYCQHHTRAWRGEDRRHFVFPYLTVSIAVTAASITYWTL